MRLGTLLAAALVAPALLVLGGPAHAATTYTVTGFDDPAPTPACNGTVCPSLRAAVEAADVGSTIQLGAGTFQLSKGELWLRPIGLHIVGAGMTSTTIEQTGEHRIFYATDDVLGVELMDLTLTGGDSVDPQDSLGGEVGGAIMNFGIMTLTRVAVTGNSLNGRTAVDSNSDTGVAWGGAIGSDGSLTVISSVIADNSARGGAGQDGSVPVRGGPAEGGAIFATGSLKVVDSTFADNIAVGGAGGVAASPDGTGADGGRALGGAILAAGKLVIRGSTFVGNTATGGDGGAQPSGVSGAGGASLGGAVNASVDQSLAVVDSTFAQNVAKGGVGGAGGLADGGGVFAYGVGPVALTADTVAENAVAGSTSSAGGNLALEKAGATRISASIVQGGSSNGVHTNCDIAPTITVDSDHNLEDTSPSQCGFGAIRGDLIGVDADLGTLGDHGGPTSTRLPSSSSPVVGAGGACTDPTADPVGPLTVDQRGEPRPIGRPCDIGAVQLPIPLNTKAPSISGPVARGTATCDPGTFLGDGAVTYHYAWTRDGQPVGSDQATYAVPVTDIGHVLRCTVVAHGPDYDSPPATSAPRTVVPSTPTLSALQQSHAIWRTPIGQSTTAPVGTTFGFQLSEPSTVTITFTRVTYRRLVNGHCVALTSANRSHPACSAAYARVGTLVRSGRAGSNSLDYHGLLGTGHYLQPGLYVATFTAKNAWGRTSPSAKLRFTVAH